MHVLFLPKWYPGRNDPQLGDFLRKQAIAVSRHVKVSVLVILPSDGTGRVHPQEELDASQGPWELHSYYRPSSIGWSPLRKLINLRRYWRAAMIGWAMIRSERGLPDLLHVHILVRPALLAWWLGRRFRIPFIISEQSSEYLDGTWERKGITFKWISRYLFRRAKTITAVSDWLGAALVELGLCKSYQVVPNVVPGLDRPVPAAGEPGHFLVVADLVDRTKNVSGVIRALAKAKLSTPEIRLTVIGDGPDRADLESLAVSLGLNGSVEFLGRLPNSTVLDHMSRAGSVVINSNVETFSVVTGEALALGKPVIATRCGGPIAFIAPENGVLIPVGDEEALRLAMLRIASHAKRYSPATIRESVKERFSNEAVGLGFHTIYSRCLGNGTNG